MFLPFSVSILFLLSFFDCGFICVIKRGCLLLEYVLSFVPQQNQLLNLNAQSKTLVFYLLTVNCKEKNCKNFRYYCYKMLYVIKDVIKKV